MYLECSEAVLDPLYVESDTNQIIAVVDYTVVTNCKNIFQKLKKKVILIHVSFTLSYINLCCTIAC